MRAVRLTRWQRPAEVCDVPAPEPGPGEVVLDVGGAGVVAALGPGAEGVEVGEPVVVYGPWGCGRCRRCSLGEEHLCERPETVRGRGAGLGRDGGLAESMVVPSPRHLVALGDVDPIRAAPLADAGLTPYHAIRRALPLAPGAGAVVIGVGGLGHVAVQLLRALSACRRIVAVDRRAEALEAAAAAG